MHTVYLCSVVGRSLVIHTQNGGADRYACANIIPSTAQDIQIGYRKNGKSFNEQAFKQQVQGLAQGVSVMYVTPNDDTDGCSYVSATVDGAGADTVASKVYTADLGQYTQDSSCISFAQGSGAASLSFSILALVMSAAFALFIQ